jgi:membrane protein YqaA with SNARE-associated domain
MKIKTGQAARSSTETQSTLTEKKSKAGAMSLWATLIIIIVSIILFGLFKDSINEFGMNLLSRYGQSRVDLVLFVITAVSCTPIILPVWGYIFAGLAMGYNIYRLSLVMAIAAALGSTVTLYLGRYYARHPWVRRHFPNLEKHPWTEGKSKRMVTLILLLGNISPIPLDVFYAACGAKKYPAVPFILTNVAGRFVRFMYVGYGFVFVKDFF